MEIGGCIKLNDNENTTYKNLQDAAKAMLRRKWSAINICRQKKVLKSRK